MEQDISKSVEEDIAEAIQEITPQEETLLNSDVPDLTTSKKISEKLDDTEKEKDELQIEEIKAEESKGSRLRQKVWQKSSTEVPKEKKPSSKKTEEVKSQKVAVEKIQVKQVGEEDPWAQITLNRCIVAAAVVVVFSMGVQMIVGFFEVDDTSMLVYSDSSFLDDTDLKLAERTILEDQELISNAEEAISELPPEPPAKVEIKTAGVTLKGKTGGCKVEVAGKKQTSAHIKEIKSTKSNYKPRDRDSESRSSKDRKEHKIEVEKKDDKHFKDQKEVKHRGHLDQHFKEEGKMLSKGKEEGRDKGSKFNQHLFPKRQEKNVKQGTCSKQHGHSKDFEKHKYFFKQNNKKYDYKVHKEYNKYRAGKHTKHYGIEKIFKKSGVGKQFAKNKFKENRKLE
ncbi:DNA ligase 1 [Narcine bancroftii]|uniref:DNA ligase 1 n=1 Tax=Narcine bancroftii TaxID=1343680 RepID=UPI003831B30A